MRRVFTINARLKTEKLDGPAGTPIAGPCNCEGSIVDGFGLADNDQTKFSTEINVGGAITCGFNRRLGTCSTDPAEKQGFWRMTVSLDAWLPPASSSSRKPGHPAPGVSRDTSQDTSRGLPASIDLAQVLRRSIVLS